MDIQGIEQTPGITTILSLVVTVSIAVVGFTIKQIYSRITEIKADQRDVVATAVIDLKDRINEAKKEAKTLIIDEERRRNDAIGGVMSQVNQQYTDLKNEMHGVRQDIKDLRDDK